MGEKDLSVIEDREYKKLLLNLKERVRSSQLKAAVKVNYELLDLYWNLGKEIVKRQEKYSWGDSFLKLLSKDLQKEFPEMKGFSLTNLKYIRKFYLFYEKSQQAVDQLQNIFSIPWGHHVYLITKCKTIEKALFYVNKTIENGWSRSILEHQIDGNLYEREGSGVSNFENILPKEQTELAKQIIKDPYNFDFLTIKDKYDEKELENALVEKITAFLLELGTGFSYIGKQVHIKVGESDFYIDLLFYHVRLHCYVVVELKTEKFKPEFAGKLNFYVTAVNKNMKSKEDNNTIGILICKDKDNVFAEYSVENILQPIGISKYEINKLFEESLPSIEVIEKKLRE